MDGYVEETYGAVWAEVYDHFHPDVDEAMIDRLVELSSEGTVLELAIGTGRVALPVMNRGVEVSGIDISPAMIEKLRAKPGGGGIAVSIGDFADVPVDGTFRLVYLVANTLFALLDQDRQVRCFVNVAQHLEEGGRFVTETFYPDLGRFDRGQRLGTVALGIDQIRLEASRHDPVNQRTDSQIIGIGAGTVEFYPVSVRYAWPSEMDLMARLAGLELEQRWGGWRREPFTADSKLHISIYRKPASRLESPEAAS